MANIKKYIPHWVTREGTRIPIPAMATSHLLNAIHMIERSRVQQLISLDENMSIEITGLTPAEKLEILNYYAQWPDGYEDLLAEAEKRQIIKRK